MSIEEHDALPWWQHQLYLEGLAEEFGDPDQAPREHEREVDLEDLGFTVKEH